MLTPGAVLAERYEIVGRIGAGGMSNVYKARDLKLNRYVAVKVLKPEFSADESFVKKFRVEAQSAAGLSHPNIVNVYDVGEEDGIHFIVMELVQGITLKHYIERKGKLDIREVLNISVQIASGMGAAHANRIIHRDIKPQNVIMSRDGKVKVTDFGIAKAADSTTVTTNAAGSVHYISPEQARGGYSDEKSDIYSLGITMYEMVTGRVPYDGENNVSVALQHIQGNMVPPRQLNPDIPRSVERIILKCTMKKPDLRYSSAKELIMDLRRALAEPDGEYVVIGPVPTVASAGRKAVGDSTTVVMNENDLAHIRKASVGTEDAPVRKGSSHLSAEERKRRQLEEERKEYEEYDNHHERKKKRQPMITEAYEDDDDSDVSPSLNKTMTIFGIIGAVIFIVVIFFIIGRASGLFSGFGNTNETTISSDSKQGVVPDCVGITQEEAVELIEKEGFKYTIKEEEDSDEEPGTVVRQTPEKGTKLDKGTKITLYVAVANEKVEIPQGMEGMSLENARNQLEKLGLKVIVNNEYSDKVDENDVISISPKSGKKVKVGSSVTLTVSKGKETKTIKMPDLTGKDIDDAKYTLTTSNLKVGDIEEQYSDSYAKDEVIWQSVEAGTEVKEDTSINLIVSLGPKETESKAPETEATQNGTLRVSLPMEPPGEYGTITVVVTYEDGSTNTVYSGEYSESSGYDYGAWITNVTGTYGTYATITSYINGTSFDSYSLPFM